MITHLTEEGDEARRKSALVSLLSDMRWELLRKILETRKKFLRRFQMGGFQLKAHHMDRARNVLLKTENEDDHIGFFLDWCREKENYRPIMDEWFDAHSNNESGEDEGEEKTTEISDELFEKLKANLKGQDSLFFLFFSPITFTEEQEKQLLHSGAEEEKPLEEEQRKEESSSPVPDTSRAELKELRGKIKERDRENRKVAKQCEQLQGKISQLNDKIKELDAGNRQNEESIVRLKNMENERIEALESEVERSKKTAAQITAKLAALEAENEQKTSELAKAKEEKESILQEYSKSVIDILDQLNSPDIIRALNEPDEVKDLLLSVVRIPEADFKTQAGKKAGNLQSFWMRLIQSETETINVLDAFDTQRMSAASFSANWPDLVDQLADMKYSLRARAVLVNFIHEILSAFYDSEKYVAQPEVPAPEIAPETITVPPPPRENIFSKDVETLGLDKSIVKRLHWKNILTIGDLVRMREEELSRIRNFGRSDLERVKAALSARGLKFHMSVHDLES